jgi:hypothetical protein
MMTSSARSSEWLCPFTIPLLDCLVEAEERNSAATEKDCSLRA